jgi:hypothetical protein
MDFNKFKIPDNLVYKLTIIVLILVVANILISFVSARQDYSVIISWWNNNGGQVFKEYFNINTFAYYHKSSILFNIAQMFSPGTSSITPQQIDIIERIIFNKAHVVNTTSLNKSTNFVQPPHVCKSIAWNNNPSDLAIFQEGIKNYYGYGTYTFDNRPEYAVDVPEWFDNWVAAGFPGPVGDWSKITFEQGESGGFWPHQNGCINFFDVPGGAGATPWSTPYNLTDTLATSTFLNPETSRGALYVPGSPTKFGSWAQLFADFGIVYSRNQDATTTLVPVIDPTSKADIWYKSGFDTKNNVYGPNFISIYGIKPDSTMLLSWVSGYSNDPGTGQKFDPYQFKNLVGMDLGSLNVGGWIGYMRGITNSSLSTDDILDNLFTDYQTNYTAKPPPPPGCNGAGVGIDTGAGAFNGAMMGAAMGPWGAVAGFIGGGLFGGLQSAQKNHCPL